MGTFKENTLGFLNLNQPLMSFQLFKKLLLILVASFLLFSCSKHQDLPIWKISKKGVPDSFMVGTIDYLNKTENAELISPFLTQKFNESETFISQIDLENSDFIITKQWIEIGMDKNLKEILSDKDFTTLKALKAKWDSKHPSSIPPPDSVKMRLLFYLHDILFHNNQDHFYFEQYWMKQAMASKKNLAGMETYQSYYQSLSKISMDDQLAFLHSIEDFESFRGELIQQISQAYYKGKYEEIHQINLDKYPYLKTNYASLFTEKHTAWITKIDGSLKQGNCFISLDIVHLTGENNLIETLLSKGYKVEKI